MNLQQGLVAGTSIQSAFAQQDNNTMDAADEDAADEDAADEDAADEDAADEDAADDKNALPVANDKSVETVQDESIDIQLTGDDEDEDEVTFSLKTYPEHGELAGVDDSSGAVIADGNVVTYSPEEGFYGEDSFSVRPYDGERSGKIGYISISVHPKSQDPGQRPVAYAGQDQTVKPNEEVLLDGTGSSDPDCGTSMLGENSHCGTLSYEWERNDNGLDLEGLEDSQLQDKLTFLAPVVEDTETLTFQLIVSDGIDGRSDPSTVDIIIQPPVENEIDAEPPVANAGENQIISEGAVQLDGTDSYDPDGDEIWPVSWRQIAGNPSVKLSNVDTLNPTFDAPSVEDNKVLSFELVVSDGIFNSDPSTVDIEISQTTETKGDDFIPFTYNAIRSLITGEAEENNWTPLIMLSGIIVALVAAAYVIKKVIHHHTVQVGTRGKVEYY
jgi:hypothetical protein